MNIKKEKKKKRRRRKKETGLRAEPQVNCLRKDKPSSIASSSFFFSPDY